MAKNTLVISCDLAETRVALIENGIIAELHIERGGAQPRGGTVGDVYLGKVTRVLPGLQAAFIDIGLERAAFLHVEDLIRPDDFETYLQGGRKHALGTGTSENGQQEPGEEDVAAEVAAEQQVAAVQQEAQEVIEGDRPEPPAPEELAAGQGDDEAAHADDEAAHGEDDVAHGEDEDDADDRGEDASAHALNGQRDSDAPPESGPRDEAPARARGGRSEKRAKPAHEDDEPAAAGESTTALPGEDLPPNEDDVPTADLVDNPDSEPPAEPEPLDDLLDNPNLPGFTISEPGAPAPKVPAPRLDARDGRGGDRGRGRRRGRGRERGRGGDRGRSEGDRGRRDGDRSGRTGDRGRGEHGGRAGRSAGVPGRLSKTTPIRDVVKEGQDIIVQVTKEPIGTKGARCSSHVSLPGRYVVYLPTLEHVGISKRIGSDRERARLRETIEAMKPPTGGLIVRTVAEGLTKKQLKQDVGYLVRLWGEVAKNRDGARSPKNLLSELDIVLKTARDLFTDDVDEIVIDDKAQYDRLVRFVEMFMPERLKDVKLFDGDEPIFDEFGIEDEISRALSRKVPLPSGGYLIIDEAEALTAIDVNTGRFVGKGSKDMEETILKTNLEAVQEIAYQLRFRNMGGLIILDLIDMEKPSSREKVRRALEDHLQRDKAKTTLNRISELGLIEMTRKRTRESLGRLLHEPCFYCDGTGHLQSKETIAYEILREIRRRRQDLPGYTVLVNCHPAVADLLTGSEKAIVTEAEKRYMRRILVTSRTEYHLEQFDLTGK
ncbi:MAG TPA: Rne/Rng family ribonuclease [Polyangiaceae bacterium]|jgi:ribonuclease G